MKRILLTTALLLLLPTVCHAYQGYWKMNPLTTDYSGNGYTLTNLNTVTQSNGRFDQGADFGDANTNKALGTTTNPLGVTCTNSYTANFWYNYRPLTTGNYYMFQKLYSAGSAGCNEEVIIVYNAGGLRLYLESDRNTGNIPYIIRTFSSGTWYMFTVSYNSASGPILYVNGSTTISLGDTGTGSQTNNAGTLWLGRENGGAAGNYTHGVIDEAVIDNSVWSNQRVKTQYAYNLGIF